MWIRIDPKSAEPIFEQIVFQVKGAVARGDLDEGDRLPSVRELAKDAAVNPNTVIRAYETLERDGVVLRRHGAGCFVTGEKSALNHRERLRRLEVSLQRAVTEAYHLGFQPDAIRKALEKRMKEIRFSGEEKKTS